VNSLQSEFLGRSIHSDIVLYSYRQRRVLQEQLRKIRIPLSLKRSWNKFSPTFVICIGQASLHIFVCSLIDEYGSTQYWILTDRWFLGAGVVHRDLKPLNLVLCEDSGSFKFIDLGACVDIRSGFNYVWGFLSLLILKLVFISAAYKCTELICIYCHISQTPDETVIDPTYAAPEHYVMPTCTPALPPDPLCSLISPIVWHLNTPDRFDLYSAVSFLYSKRTHFCS